MALNIIFLSTQTYFTKINRDPSVIIHFVLFVLFRFFVSLPVFVLSHAAFTRLPVSAVTKRLNHKINYFLILQLEPLAGHLCQSDANGQS